MNDFTDMLWIETRKVTRSKLPIFTVLGSLFMPVGIAFLIMVAKNPRIANSLGLVGAKANLMAYSGTTWSTYLTLVAEIVAAGGFFLIVLIISWIFGREFVDGTLKDLLSVPVHRSSLLLAKFVVGSAWFCLLALLIFIASLLMGVLIKLPEGSTAVILQSISVVSITACLVIASVTPFAFFASIGNGYLLPIGMAILTMVAANLLEVLGWGKYFPWFIPAIYAQGKTALLPVSYIIVIITGLVGMVVTYLWWMYADQNR
jgi:ABC-2 type transport system permease protein